MSWLSVLIISALDFRLKNDVSHKGRLYRPQLPQTLLAVAMEKEQHQSCKTIWEPNTSPLAAEYILSELYEKCNLHVSGSYEYIRSSVIGRLLPTVVVNFSAFVLMSTCWYL